jgi:hypothetical protein
MDTPINPENPVRQFFFEELWALARSVNPLFVFNTISHSVPGQEDIIYAPLFTDRAAAEEYVEIATAKGVKSFAYRCSLSSNGMRFTLRKMMEQGVQFVSYDPSLHCVHISPIEDVLRMFEESKPGETTRIRSKRIV